MSDLGGGLGVKERRGCCPCFSWFSLSSMGEEGGEEERGEGEGLVVGGGEEERGKGRRE